MIDRLKHPETRAGLDRFDLPQLRTLHEQLLGKPTKDGIKRRVALKVHKELQRRYKKGEFNADVKQEPVLKVPKWPCYICEEVSMHRCCPKCMERADGQKAIKAMFGFRTVRGKVVAQSWCYGCRNKGASKA